MANENKMTILEALVQLRNDLKLWVANNLRTKLDKNLGTEASGKILSIDSNGDIISGDLDYKDTAVDGQYVSAVNQTNGVINVTHATLNAASVGLDQVNNTSDVNKPVSTAQQEALDALKEELSESITSESEELTVADGNGNIVTRINANGIETTNIMVQSVAINGISAATEEFVVAKIAEAQLGEGDVDLSAYYTKTETNNAIAAAIPTNISAFTNDKGYLVSRDLDNYATFDDIPAVPSVINNLTSTSTTDALSANQGTVLKNYVDEKLGDIETLLAAL